MVLKLLQQDSDKKIIGSLLEEAILVNEDIYSELMEMEENLPEIKRLFTQTFLKIIKIKRRENLGQIWVHNFPWCKADDLFSNKSSNNDVNHDLELFGLDKQNLNKQTIKRH